MPRRFARLADLAARVGQELARSDAVLIDRDRVVQQVRQHRQRRVAMRHRGAEGAVRRTRGVDMESTAGLRCGPRSRRFEPIDGGAQLVIEATLEREGGDKPVAVVESVVRQYT